LSFELGFAILCIVLALAVLLPVPTFYFSILAIVFMYAAMAESWNLIGGYAGYQSFGNAAFFGIGAYVVAILLRDYGISPLITMFLGGVFAMGLAVVIGYPTLRLRATAYFSLVTLGIALVMSSVFVASRALTGGGIGIQNVHIPGLALDMESQGFYILFLALLVATVFAAHRVERSKLGFGLLAIRENEDAALVLGVDATKLKLKAFLLSAFFTGLAGGLYAPYLSWINPGLVFGVLISITPVLMTIFGGRGVWIGPVIGGFTLGLVRQYMTFTVQAEFSLVVYGVVLIITVIAMPRGVFGFVKERLEKYARG
jgi:branched-chain amino acid transport system permease protein